jgi:cobalt-precorrin 5A hydrolase
VGGAKAVIVAGVGFRQGVDADEILALVARALGEVSVATENLAQFATAAARSTEPGLVEAARRLGLPVSAVSINALAATAPALRTGSERVRALYGVGSVAEAAALACVGPQGELLAPRIASARATCAIAQGPGP